jgi:predicted amidohydrolase
VVLAMASDAEGVILADLDLGYLADVRRRLPALTHRRPAEIYR